jgi:uncharacterized membrane protein
MISVIPTWFLILTYWLHLTATVIWVGGLVVLALVVIPSGRRSLMEEPYGSVLLELRNRFRPISWFCLGVLVITGMFQMNANPFYQGFLEIRNSWTVAILLKHLAIAIMVGLSIYETYWVHPALQRMVQLQSAGSLIDKNRLLGHQHVEARVYQVNLVISFVVLGLTSWARAI